MQAAHLPCGSLERLLKVTAFTVSIYSCVYRTYVPFKSPAGETSETVAPDRGIRAIAEKVSHPQAKLQRHRCLDCCLHLRYCLHHLLAMLKLLASETAQASCPKRGIRAIA